MPSRSRLLFAVPIAIGMFAVPAPADQAKPSAPAPPAAAKPTGPATAESMSGVSFEGLDDAKKKLAVEILNENGCDCGCGLKLGVCRRDDSTCGRSLPLANRVVALVKQGKGKDEVVKTVLPPPTKYVQFALAVGDSPSIGPADAKVTILHYLDYQ